MSTDNDTSSTYAQSLFDVDNYLYFYADGYLTEKQTKLEVEFVRDHLQLNLNASVLDLACGHGRHANAIAPYSGAVLGLDTNSQFIALAKVEASRLGLPNVSFEQRDIRTLDSETQFDRAMLLNTVFGLFEDAENERLLRSVNKVLNHQGLFCLDVINRDTILSQFESDGIVERQGNFLLDRLTFDYRTGRMDNARVYLKDGRRTDAPFSIRLYNYSELNFLLEGAGFSIVDACADWAGSPMDFRARKIVVIAKKVREIAS
jgi:SAM-dependent methyltransferase